MKIVIVAGGTGTRFWPLSRKAFPKQFIRMFDGKSTLQLAIDRLAPTFGLNNIIISTNQNYKKYVAAQLPGLPAANIITEPEKRDVGPAVGLNLIHLKKQGYSGPVAILWVDHLMDKVPHFIKSLQTAEQICADDPKKVVLISEKPRFPNHNLGWIHFGKKNAGADSYGFVGFKYKPEYATCEEMFKSGEWDWNTGYMIVDIDHALNQFKTYVPEIYNGLQKIYDAIGTPDEAKVTNEVYPAIPKLHFDYVIAENIGPEDAVVVRSDMSWSDPGTLYALKEALVKHEADNFEIGDNIKTLDTTDSLLVNEEHNKVVVTVGLEGMVVVNTEDALLIVPKTEILKVTDLVNGLTEDPKTEKYT